MFKLLLLFAAQGTYTMREHEG